MATTVRVLLQKACEHAEPDVKALWDKKDVSAILLAMSQAGRGQTAWYIFLDWKWWRQLISTLARVLYEDYVFVAGLLCYIEFWETYVGM